VLVDHKGGQVIVGATVFETILIVRENVNEIVPAVITPGHRPLAGASGIVVRVLAAAAIPPFQVARRVDDQTGGAQTVSHGLGCKTDHFADGGHVGGGIRDVGQMHLLD
jgi:hypothetical protein